MAYYLGIDLGTTYTAAAAERDGVVESLTLGNRTASVPSVVFLRDDGEILVGEAATRRAITDPGRVAREFKRRVGDPTPIILGGTPYAAEMLMARLLRWSVDQVREQQGEPPRAIALTHPANWGPYKLDLFAQAVRQVDLDAALTLPEPVAAATFYASQRRLEPGSVVAVYDLGGGTFDAAMVRRTDHGFETIGSPEGMERLGGIDFDEAVFAHVRNAVGDGLERLDPDEPAAQAAVARLRQECIDAKEALSSDTDVSIPVLLPGLQTEVRLTRSEFEAMIRPAISETIVALRRAIRSASVDADAISAVLLVGGSSRIPLVAQMVGAELGRPIAIDAHPKDAIAFGAAIAVAEQRGAASPETVTTILTDNRPPPPTVSSDAGRRPAPPGAAAAAAGVAAGAAAGAARPPLAGARPAPPVGPSGRATPAAAGARPAPPGAGPSRPAPPPGAPTTPGAARPAPPAARGPVDRATLAPPSAPGRPSGASGPSSAAGHPAPPPGRAGAPGYRPAGAGRETAPAPPATTPFAGVPRAGGVPPGGHSSGGFPAAPGGRVTAGDNRTLWIVLALVAVVALVVIVIAATRGGGSDGAESASGDTTGGSGTDESGSGYSAEVEQAFMDACVPGAGQAVCECSYDLIVETIPFERFEEMESALREDSTTEFEELTAIQSECQGAA
ncbi:MAG TPA: Hsp70 family protein [Acidimicrobiales bacterium]